MNEFVSVQTHSTQTLQPKSIFVDGLDVGKLSETNDPISDAMKKMNSVN
jgi:hypothetical protein